LLYLPVSLSLQSCWSSASCGVRPPTVRRRCNRGIQGVSTKSSLLPRPPFPNPSINVPESAHYRSKWNRLHSLWDSCPWGRWTPALVVAIPSCLQNLRRLCLVSPYSMLSVSAARARAGDWVGSGGGHSAGFSELLCERSEQYMPCEGSETCRQGGWPRFSEGHSDSRHSTMLLYACGSHDSNNHGLGGVSRRNQRGGGSLRAQRATKNGAVGGHGWVGGQATPLGCTGITGEMWGFSTASAST
jgi:hypothetical protein